MVKIKLNKSLILNNVIEKKRQKKLKRACYKKTQACWPKRGLLQAWVSFFSCY
jgi:hypothetical protein